MNAKEMASSLLRGRSEFTDHLGESIPIRDMFLPKDGDEPYLVQLLKRIIEEQTAIIGEAITEIKEKRPDIPLSNVSVPDLTDEAACKEFREELELPHIKSELEHIMAYFSCLDEPGIVGNPLDMLDVIEFCLKGCEGIHRLGEALSALTRTGTLPSAASLKDGLEAVEFLSTITSVDDRISTSFEGVPVNEHTQAAITLTTLHDNLSKIVKAVEAGSAQNPPTP